eukprot:4293715-Pleurochrysis_carterae.AAC.1
MKRLLLSFPAPCSILLYLHVTPVDAGARASHALGAWPSSSRQIGGYDAASEMVLILDVARFKYPPHWAPLHDVWNAMCALDTSTGDTCRRYA